MYLTHPLDAAHMPEACDTPLPLQRAPCASAHGPLEELVEMGYQQYLAERALQELFENGTLQGFET